MSAEAMKWLRTQMPRTVEGKRDSAAKAILYCLADRHSPTHDLFPSQRTISRDTGLSRSTISAKLAMLEAQGYLTRDRRYNRSGGPSRGQRTSDSYTLNLDRGPDDLDTREVQPAHLRRKTPVEHDSTNPDRETPTGFDDLPDFLALHRGERHSRGSSEWSMEDLLDEVEARFVWAFGRSPLSRDGFAAHLTTMRGRLGLSKGLERAAVTGAFDDMASRGVMAGDMRNAQKVVLMAIADALIDARESLDCPEIVAAEGLAGGKYVCALATDGARYPNTREARRDRDAYDRGLERQRLGLS